MTAPDISCVRHLTIKAAEGCTCTGQLQSVCNCVNRVLLLLLQKAYLLT